MLPPCPTADAPTPHDPAPFVTLRGLFVDVYLAAPPTDRKELPAVMRRLLVLLFDQHRLEFTAACPLCLDTRAVLRRLDSAHGPAGWAAVPCPACTAAPSKDGADHA